MLNAKTIPLFALAALTACAHPPRAQGGDPVRVQLLGINDFHGNLEPPPDGWKTAEGRVPAGGAAYLGAHLAARRAEVPHTLIVSAGDLIGASPLISGLFHDEPTIEVMNKIGLDINAVGNHEFDEGLSELLRMQRGGCHPSDGCQTGHDFKGADFPFLAANVRRKGQEETIFPPYVIKTFDGVKVGFIGMTLEGTPDITPPGVGGELTFSDEAETTNAVVKQLKAQGVRAIVVLIHEGGFPTGGYDGCGEISGPIVDIVQRMDPEVDLVISGHTHRAYSCVIGGRPVTSAGSYGRLYTRLLLDLDRATGDVLKVDAKNVIVDQGRPEQAEVAALVADYRQRAEPKMKRVVGQVTGPLSSQPNEHGESELGDLIGDAQLLVMKAPDMGGAEISFMNPGGIRADLNSVPDVTYDALYRVHPFGNILVTMTVTGQQLLDRLEAQFVGPEPRIMQVSANFSYRWDPKQPEGQKVWDVRVNGVPLDPKRDYRVALNNFMAKKGIFAQGRDVVTGPIDLDALEAFFKQRSPVQPSKLGRILRQAKP